MSDDKRKSPRLPLPVETLLKQGSNAKPVIIDAARASSDSDADIESFLRDLAPQAVAPNATGIERRRYPRFPFGAPITVHGASVVHATGIDASLGGISLCAERLVLKIGEQVRLTLAARDGKATMELEAIVRRTLPSPHPGTFAFGIELTSISSDKLATLARVYRTWLP